MRPNYTPGNDSKEDSAPEAENNVSKEPEWPQTQNNQDNLLNIDTEDSENECLEIKNDDTDSPAQNKGGQRSQTSVWDVSLDAQPTRQKHHTSENVSLDAQPTRQKHHPSEKSVIPKSGATSKKSDSSVGRRSSSD